MAIVYLLRHCESLANENGILAGRSDVGLSAKGANQAQLLVPTLRKLGVDQIISSPINRCIETITPYLEIDKRLKKKFLLAPEFQEMDYGLWSGKKLRQLALKREWRKVKKDPVNFTFPEGESFREAAARVSVGLAALSKLPAKSKILLISHGDIIKIAIQQVLGSPFPSFQQLVIDPASLSAISTSKPAVILFINRSSSEPESSKAEIRSRTALGGGTRRG